MVLSAPASDPACGSESPKLAVTKRPEVISGRYRSFCASLPKRKIVSATRLFTATVTAVEAQPWAISVIATAYATGPAAEPPYCSGTFTPISPSAASSRSWSAGNRASRSICPAMGTRTFCA